MSESHAGLTALIASIYIVACLPVFLKLWPRLSPILKPLAGAMLLAQLLLILIALHFRPSSNWAAWLLNLDGENNIPTMVASAQLALVGCVAFLIAKYQSMSPSWKRAHYVGLGIVFLYFGAEEYINLRASFDWVPLYTIIGAVTAVSICLAAVKAPPTRRIWHICLLLGLAMAGFGSIVIEELRFKSACANAGLWIDGACRAFIVEETLEFAGVWLALIAVLGLFSTAVAPQWRAPRLLTRTLYVIPLLWILLVSHTRVIHNAEGLLMAQPASVLFEHPKSSAGFHLYGYQISKNTDTLGLVFYATGRKNTHFSQGVSVHLVDQQSGESLASSNKYWENEIDHFIGPGRQRIYRQRIEIELPKHSQDNRAVWLVLTLWRNEDEHFQKHSVVSSDHPLLGDSQVILSEFAVKTEGTAPTSTTPLAKFESGKRLADVDLPEHAAPGETLYIEFAWSADEFGREDVVQFLHFVNADSSDHWGFDQQPLGARMPTRLWYSGLADSEIWAVPLPADLAPGRYQVFTGLYRLSDQLRLTATDAGGRTYVDDRVPLGEVVIEAR